VVTLPVTRWNAETVKPLASRLRPRRQDGAPL